MLDSSSSRFDFSEPYAPASSEDETRSDYSAAISRAVPALPASLDPEAISAALSAAFAAGVRAAAERAAHRQKVRGDQPKYQIIADLLQREQGCMAWEIREATGWTTFSIPRWAEAAGLVLHKVRIAGNTFRFFGIPREMAETMDYEVIGPPKDMRIVFRPKAVQLQA